MKRWPASSGGYPPTDQIELHVSTKDRVTASGREGTVIFRDTSGLHRGGFALENARLLSVFAYISPASPYNSKRPIRIRPDYIAGRAAAGGGRKLGDLTRAASY